MKKKLIALSGTVLGFAPAVALAQVATGGNPTTCASTTTISNLQQLLCKLSELLNAILPVLIALGVVFFVWGVITFVIANDEEAKTKGRNRMIYGILGLAVIIGMWGLVRLVTNTFGLNNVQNINLPTVPY